MNGARWGPPPERRKGPPAATKGPLQKTRNSNDGAHNSRLLTAVKPFSGSAAAAVGFGGKPRPRITNAADQHRAAHPPTDDYNPYLDSCRSWEVGIAALRERYLRRKAEQPAEPAADLQSGRRS